MSYEIHRGDVLARMREMPDCSVHCVVTSPPYWGLRDYGCEGQIGLEATPAEYLAKIVEVFREVRRVLRGDGTCFVNMGDSYASTPSGSFNKGGRGSGALEGGGFRANIPFDTEKASGLKPKDLVGMPWRLAFALQEDGWWLRQDIIWAKPNPMPESVTDRCTKAHEYLFLLTKSARYFFDAEAIKEASITGDERRPYTSQGAWAMDGRPEEQRHGGKPRNGASAMRGQGSNRDGANGPVNRDGRDMATVGVGTTRNKRSVWEIATEPFPEAHFATFPTKLVEPCILAGTGEKGCCDACGAPWVRVVEKTTSFASGSGKSGNVPTGKHAGGTQEMSGDYDIRMGPVTATRTTGWAASCACGAGATPCTVLDPFSGSGTTGLVALANRCNYIGIELNEEYAAMSARRLAEATRQGVMAYA